MYIVLLFFSSLLINIAELQTNETTTVVWTTINNSNNYTNNYMAKQLYYNSYAINEKSFTLSEYPYVVFIEMSKTYLCTGTLIAPLYVLTAGHCTYGHPVSKIDVYRVSKITKLSIPKKINQVYHHNNYNNTTHIADISLIRIKNPFHNFEDFISLTEIPLEFKYDFFPNCVTIGFDMINKVEVGRHLHTTEYQGYMASISINHGRDRCKFYPLSEPSDWNEFICSKPEKNDVVCPGDVGNPLICDGYQYAIATSYYNVKGHTNLVCGNYEIQIMNVFVYYYKDWINTIITDTGNTIIISEKSYMILLILMFYKLLR